MSKWLDTFGTIATQFQIGIGGTGLRRLRFKNGFRGDLEWTPTADRTLTLPDASGTVAIGDIGARVYHSVDQSIASATNTALAFNSERYDTDTLHDTATNNSRLTCNTAGKYLIGGFVSFASNAIGARQINVALNGGVIATEIANAVGGGGNTAFTISTVYSLAVGDYVQIQAYQASGMSLNVVASPEFYMHRLP